MIKGKLLENIRRTVLSNGLGSSDDLGKISLKSVEVATALLFADVIMMLIKKDSDLDFFTKSYNDISIDYDHYTKQYTSQIPIKILQLPNNNGVVAIKGIGSNRLFYRSSYNNIDLFEDMDENNHYDRNLFVMEGLDKVRYTNFSYEAHNVRKVMMKLIPDFMEYSYDEEVPLPSGRTVEFTNIVAKQLFQSNKLKDTSADGI